MEWEIVRADGDIEVYNATPQGDYYDYSEEYPESGLLFCTSCHSICDIFLKLSPMDLRYNGARFTTIFSLQECGTTNITDPISVNIQGEHVHRSFL